MDYVKKGFLNSLHSIFNLSSNYANYQIFIYKTYRESSLEDMTAVSDDFLKSLQKVTAQSDMHYEIVKNHHNKKMNDSI